mmetsp:Transcript_25598/g.29296  ORF Transcript_25598/g.29296 Transcript_25598/m.29296 type:complete len:333 (-) Transcript_25598:498-1496(-)
MESEINCNIDSLTDEGEALKPMSHDVHSNCHLENIKTSESQNGQDYLTISIAEKNLRKKHTLSGPSSRKSSADRAGHFTINSKTKSGAKKALQPYGSFSFGMKHNKLKFRDGQEGGEGEAPKRQYSDSPKVFYMLKNQNPEFLLLADNLKAARQQGTVTGRAAAANANTARDQLKREESEVGTTGGAGAGISMPFPGRSRNKKKTSTQSTIRRKAVKRLDSYIPRGLQVMSSFRVDPKNVDGQMQSPLATYNASTARAFRDLARRSNVRDAIKLAIGGEKAPTQKETEIQEQEEEHHAPHIHLSLKHRVGSIAISVVICIAIIIGFGYAGGH